MIEKKMKVAMLVIMLVISGYIVTNINERENNQEKKSNETEIKYETSDLETKKNNSDSIEMKATFITNSGDQSFYYNKREYLDSMNDKYAKKKAETIQSMKSRFIDSIVDDANTIYFADKTTFYRFIKAKKELEYYDLEQLIRGKIEKYLKIEENKNISYLLPIALAGGPPLTVEEVFTNIKTQSLKMDMLNETYLLFRHYLYPDQDGVEIDNNFIFDLENKKIINLIDNFCPGIYCNGPFFDHQLDRKSFIMTYGAGDACWSVGEVYLYTIEPEDDIKTKKLLKFGSGCSDEKFDYIGTFEHTLLYVERIGEYQEENEEMYGALYMRNINTDEEEILIEKGKIPEGTEWIYLDKNRWKIVMEKGESMYEFDLNTRKFSHELLKQSQESSPLGLESSQKYEKFITENKDFIKIEFRE